MTDKMSGAPAGKKKRLPLFVWLAYGLLATLLFVGVTFSSYVTTSSSLDQARVAKFNVTEKDLTMSQDIEMEITPLKPAYFKFAVTNKHSEVAVRYTITVEKLTNNVPLQFRLNEEELLTQVEGKNEYTYSKNSPAGEEVTYTLEMLLNPGDGTVPEDLLQYMGMVEHIRVTVDAVQID